MKPRDVQWNFTTGMISFFQRNKHVVAKAVVWLLYTSICMPVIVGVEYIFPFVFPKAVFFQIVIECAVAGYVALILIDRSYMPRKDTLFVLVGLWMTSIVCAWVFGVDRGLSFWSKAERMDGVFWYLHVLAFFVMACGMLKTKRAWFRFLQFASLVCSIVGGIALVSKYAPALIPFGDQTRLAGTFGNPAFLATYFVVMLFINGALFGAAREEKTRWVWLALGLFSFVCVFLSGTRGAYVGVIAGIIVALAGIALSAWQKYKKVVLTIGGIGMVLIVSLVVFPGFWNRISPFFASRVYSVWNIPKPRLIVWGMAWDAFKERPVFGWGSENILYALNAHFRPEVHTYEMAIFDRPHNKILDLMVGQGLFGLVSYCILYGFLALRMFKLLVRRGREGRDVVVPAWILGLLGAYFVQDLVLFEMPSSSVMLFLLFALVYWVPHDDEQEYQGSVHASRSQSSEKGGTHVVHSSAAYHFWIWYGTAGLAIMSLFIGCVVPLRAARGVVQTAMILSPNTQDYVVSLQQALQRYVANRSTSTFLDREGDVALARRLDDFSTLDIHMPEEKAYQDFARSLIQNLAQDIHNHPYDYDAAVQMGSLLFHLEGSGVAQDMRPTAHEVFVAATQRAPQREDAWQYLFLWAMQNDKQQEAKQYADKLLELNNQMGIFWFYQVEYEARWGTTDRVDAALAQAVAKGYDMHQRAGDWELFASSLYMGGKYKQAIHEYTEIVQIENAPWDFALRNYVRLLELYVETNTLAPAHQAVIDLLSRMPSERVQEITQYLKDNHLYY